MTTLMMLSFTVIMMILSKTQESMADVNQVIEILNHSVLALAQAYMSHPNLDIGLSLNFDGPQSLINFFKEKDYIYRVGIKERYNVESNCDSP